MDAVVAIEADLNAIIKEVCCIKINSIPEKFKISLLFFLGYLCILSYAQLQKRYCNDLEISEDL